MPPPIRVLLVEDNPGDAALARNALAAPGHVAFSIVHVDRLAAALLHLAADTVDVILLDLRLPDAEGLEALAAVQAQAPATPVVVLTGLADEELAVAALRQGAQDHLQKGQLQPGMLARALRHAIERQRLEESLRRAREELEQRVEERTAELAHANDRLRTEVAERLAAEAGPMHCAVPVEDAKLGAERHTLAQGAFDILPAALAVFGMQPLKTVLAGKDALARGRLRGGGIAGGV
ncbi:MAG TPA: response regulator, partial [Gemmataceae bacterium]|nr:response regulator [Gemmataceae bacterium]